jgi:hypothetical protein
VSKEYRLASEIVSSLFSSISGERLKEANEFFGSWKALVGDKIAAHSRVVDVDKGVVIVEVDHPGWNQQLSFIKKRVLAELGRKFPDLGIISMTVRVRPDGSMEYTRANEVIGSALRREIADKTEETEDVQVKEGLDDPLKDVLSRLRASIKKGRSLE